MKFPCIEEWHPIDVVTQQIQIDVIEYLYAGKRRFRWLIVFPVTLMAARTRLIQRQLRRQALLVGVIVTSSRVVFARLFNEGVPRAGFDQRLCNADCS